MTSDEGPKGRSSSPSTARSPAARGTVFGDGRLSVHRRVPGERRSPLLPVWNGEARRSPRRAPAERRCPNSLQCGMEPEVLMCADHTHVARAVKAVSGRSGGLRVSSCDPRWCRSEAASGMASVGASLEGLRGPISSGFGVFVAKDNAELEHGKTCK